ncbi:hypothetical protein O181_044832 [Austropuccinia psidii MF-1]|uniref:Uncharacterized protein n=1 Tax=Austropuccinia psidii MF-1 TaxID=1389203 RepID=A0A9Q3DN72_9BASI|nr:hypothetical protein [Austropuccinia psidii MF-1]
MVCGPWAMDCTPQSMVHGGYWWAPAPNFSGNPGVPWDQKVDHVPFSPIWPGPIQMVQDHQDPGLPKVSGEVLGDDFSPKGVLNHHLGGFKGGP